MDRALFRNGLPLGLKPAIFRTQIQTDGVGGGVVSKNVLKLCEVAQTKQAQNLVLKDAPNVHFWLVFAFVFDVLWHGF